MGDDEGPDVFKSLGIRRRSRPDSAGGEPAAGAESAGEAAGAEGRKSFSGLGIKRRRSGPQATITEEELAAEDAAASEDSPPQAGGSGAPRGSALAPSSGSVEVIDVLAPLRGKLGSDQTAVLLANYLRGRPALIERLPARLWELKRTHGRYLGDGRVERTLPIGFRPALVLYTLPLYADGPPEFTKTGELIDPGIHAQPTYSDAGFAVGHTYNRLGDFYVYVVFQDDGQALEWPPAPGKKQERARGRDAGPKDPDSLGRSLGIKRRK